MTEGFMAGIALGQTIVGSIKKSPNTSRLQSAKKAAYKRMIARQSQSQSQSQLALPTNFINQNSFQGKCQIRGRNKVADDFMLTSDGQGELLSSIKANFSQINAWIKKISGGLLDLNMTLALFFIIRGIRKLILEKQTPNAWQMIWWAMSILRGWKSV